MPQTRRPSHFCGCRPWCKKFLTLLACDRVRSSVRPLCAAFQKPRAGMVISGSGPYLKNELVARRDLLVFPIRICSIVLPIQVVVFSHPLGTVANGST